ncbi:MAG TPA: endolytic transglycosylase MltG [Candidatus Binatia bacterium]|nr:endolytic transglycosylase MltG [Candidatus Binatia bacterium]
MTIRGGGSPRRLDPAAGDQARPMQDVGHDPAHDAGTADWAAYGSSAQDAAALRRIDRRNGSGRNGVRGLFKFALFALVLAVIVLVALVTVLRPLISGTIVGWASDNPSALGIPFVADMVRDDLGTALTTAPSTDTTQMEFVVQDGDTATTIADRLHDQGFLTDPRAFVFISIQRDLTSQLEAGTFLLQRSMTPDQLVTALLQAKDLAISVPIREGLRVEQVVAKLETLPLTMDVGQFYQLVEHPTPAILAAHPWLDLPKGASLEGFLAPGTYSVLPDISPEELVDKMLDHFYELVGQDRIDVPKSRGMSFYQVMTLASLVERESILDSERPLIAGVFQNRLDPKLFPLGMFQSDATIFYVNDSIQLAKIPIAQWISYTFWAPVNGKLQGVKVPADLIGYDTYSSKGLMPGPICTPSVASIDAALNPDTKAGYLFFLAKHDGSNTTAFARTQAEHQRNIAKYGSGN